MPKVVLLPDWSAPPDWKEIIGKVIDPDKELPEPWQPHLEEARTLEQTEAIAFPTPFAWAEMMSAVIRQGLFNHLLFKYYEDIFLGLILGYLQLEITDLKRFELGRVLTGTDERYRYFGLLRATPRAPEIQGRVFGATAPESLLWPSPRCTNNEWRNLRQMIQTDTHLNLGYQLLAELRDLMLRQRQWQPSEVPWMKGLDHIIRDLKGSENAQLVHNHSLLAGPVLATIGGGRLRPFYLPVYQAGFAAELSKGFTGVFKQEAGAIIIYDDKNRQQYEIRMPPTPADGDLLLAGGGTVRHPEGVGRIQEFNMARLRLENDERGNGLYSLLQPLDESLRKDQKFYNALGKVHDEIREQPYFYPDVMRIPIKRLGQATAQGMEVNFSTQAYQLVFDTESFGLPTFDELTKRDGNATQSFILDHTHNGVTRKQIFLEAYQGRQIGDLTAFGWALWLYFIGKASWQAEKLLDDELTPVLTSGKDGRLFELMSALYQKTAEQQRQQRYLARLQRFLHNYAERARRADANPLAQLCQEASRVFVKTIWPEQAMLENGYLSAQWQTIEMNGARLELARDVRERR